MPWSAEEPLHGHPGRPGSLADVHDDAAKLASLKFLGHWIGDIHQPLHVSFADDRGGNFIRESGPCVNSLHTVWDTCIIEKKLGTDPQTIAQDLLDGLPDSDRAAWVAVPIAGWADESFHVGYPPDTIGARE